MADFDAAFKKTMKHEGGYVDDPSDAGGETYKGVSRKYHPTWSGWKIIDEAKSQNDFPNNLKSKSSLTRHIKIFYKQHYWDRLLGDQIPDQDIALELFDTAVNMGVGRAGKFLQQALNFLNRNEKLFPDLVDDGHIGTKTLNALEVCLAKDSSEPIFKIINILQGQHYLEYMRASAIQEKFCRGWLHRVEFLKV